MLENPAEVIDNLRGAIRFLSAAHLAAGETEGERTNLNGSVRDMIFGLNSSVDALINLVEEKVAVDFAATQAGQKLPGTYELVGPKVNSNPEGVSGHRLVRHGLWAVEDAPRDFDGLRRWMASTDFEGIVWHHPNGRMAKLKKRDFPSGQEP